MEFPNKCPYCKKDNIPHCIGAQWEYEAIKSDSAITGISLELHRCIHCKNPIFIAKRETRAGSVIRESKLLFSYPLVDVNPLPKRIGELSPNAYKTYSQTMLAKEQNLDMLVGAGLRIALEWLVWDYLLKVRGKRQEEIENLSLYKRIELMNESYYVEVCTRLIRLFGNDSVHIVKQLDFSAEEVSNFFELLCGIIDGELQIKEVEKKLPPKKST